MVLLILSHCEDQMRCNLKCLSKYLANKHETVAIITSRIPEKQGYKSQTHTEQTSVFESPFQYLLLCTGSVAPDNPKE